MPLVVEWNDAYGDIYNLSFLSMAYALHPIHCIDIWSYVVNLWFRPYRYNIIYWAQRCSFIPWWVWRQEFMCIYMLFCMVLRVGCDEVYCDILWMFMSHIALRLIGPWINYMWVVWILGYWFDVVALKLTWEVIVFLVRWVAVWLKGSWRYYLFSLLAIHKSFNFFTCYLFGYGILSTFMLLYFSCCYGNLYVMVRVGDFLLFY